MSWFEGLTSKLQEVTEQVSEQAKSAIPLNNDFLEKLTLSTPELDEERKRLDNEERRKEHIKDCLAGLLPWETRDPERDILVEECKDAILKLSQDGATFKGPYLMPGMKVKDVGTSDGESEEEKGKIVEEKPTEESLDKLATLEPLPKLLGCFDLDAHVGLIQRILTEDPHLVEMQSKLSGGGEREYYFWKNYFFHCAFARYEAGLSIDEIWNDEDPAERKAKEEAAAKEAATKAAAKEAEQKVAAESKAEEETITFDNHKTESKSTETPSVPSEGSPEIVSTDVAAVEASSLPADVTTPSSAASASAAGDSSAIDFEKIAAEGIEDDDGFGDDDGFDVELDELEAEIARELED
ncbi:expressed unknown protein [Seminavis robusta]|uniref:BSD domain-containing protein n=1 Tax=Seminavis robusta TaxID=568900 RepID=A0A9N8DJ81_9STRA|nr:expressed unknown protein [Seminavis robusta]|eukprot:Sro182_g079400.1 n/a (354) ;mRNA; f:60704-61926